MKCFTVNESSTLPFIAVRKEPYAHISVGEPGRGRSEVRIPLSIVDYPETPNALERASLIRVHARDQLIVVTEHPNDTERALVLTDIAAGYRGSTTWTAAQYVLSPCPNRDADISAFSGQTRGPSDGQLTGLYCVHCGLRLETTDYGSPYKHPDDGFKRFYGTFPADSGVTVLAEGRAAQGAAGAMGHHMVRLLIMAPGATFRVKRSGRLYGAPPILYVRWTGTSLMLGTRDEVFPHTIADEATGELV